MKTSNWLVLKKLDDIERLLYMHHAAVNERFDKLEKMIVVDKNIYVTPELEQAIKATALEVASIDKKVPDKAN